MSRHRIIIAAAVLLAAGSYPGDRAVAAGSSSSYCPGLSWILRHWTTACFWGSDCNSVAGRSYELSFRVSKVAWEAQFAGRPDVARALFLSARWVAAGATANSAAHTRDTDLGERMMKAGWAANNSIKSDCGFVAYPKSGD